MNHVICQENARTDFFANKNTSGAVVGCFEAIFRFTCLSEEVFNYENNNANLLRTRN